MIARLAPAAGGIAYEAVPVDMQARMSQLHPDCVRLNPNMTVPTLALTDGGLTVFLPRIRHRRLVAPRRESS